MTINHRFFVRKEDNCIIDRLNPAAKYLVRYCWEDAPEDDMHLREQLHGALSPGAPRGAKNGNFRNGDWTADAIKERKWLRSLVRSFAKTGTTG